MPRQEAPALKKPMDQQFGLKLACTLLGLCAACSSSAPLPPAPTATAGPTPFPSLAPSPTPVPGTLYVDPTQDLGAISPLIYGSNYGPWVSVPFQMFPQVFDSGLTILRFPAGSWGDQNNLQSYEIDTFMGILNKMRSGALINVRLEHATPAQAAQLVRYVNIDRGYGVTYWGIGNEPDLYTGDLHANYDTPQFNREWRAIALAMQAVDPSIKLVGPEISQFTANPAANPKDSRGLDWMTEFLKANGDLVDVVSIHRYPFPHGDTAPPATIAQLQQNVHEWDGIIPYLRGLVRSTTGRELPIAVTEFNSHYTKAMQGPATPDSFYNAIWLADVLGRMIRGRVFMANQWMMSGGPDQGGWGLISQDGPRPSYYVYQMYRMFGSELVYSASDDPNLSIYAARRPDGSLTVLVINLDLNPKSKPIKIVKMPGPTAEAWLFDPTHTAQDLGSQPLSGTLAFPPESITLYVIEAHP
jgi:hypothetical protein